MVHVMSITATDAVVVHPTRNAILSAALDLFSRLGYEATAVPAIAAHAGVATGTVYRHFEGKRELANELYRRERVTMAAPAFAGLEPTLPAADWFRRFWLNLVSFAQTSPAGFDYLELHFHSGYLDSASAGVDAEAMAPLMAFFERTVAQGITRGLSPALCCAMLWGCLRGVLSAARSGEVDLSKDTIAGACEAAWSMFAADRPPLTGAMQSQKALAGAAVVRKPSRTDWRVW